ncbi:MAG: RICIN domain-containing protein [Bacteroidales bacterium]|jgi:hypothetical protein|nr:RICIN domain-containing protein [Bacteroidales bacterium]
MKNTFLISILSLLLLFGAQAQENEEIVESRKGFWIQSAMNYQKDNGGYWDIPGTPEKIEQRANIQVWNIDDGKDREFFLKTCEEFGVYQIVPGDRNGTIMLDVAGGEENFKKNGANIATWRMNGRDWQKFKFVHLGNGEFKIHTLSDMVICLAGRKNANGTNVHIWEDHDGDWMTWYLIDPETKKAWIPEEQAQEPTFFIENNLTYESNIHSLKFEGTVTNVDYTDNLIKITIDGHESGRNPGNGQLVDQDKTVEQEIFFSNGIYYQFTYDMSGGKQADQIHPYTDENNMESMSIGAGRYKEKLSETPDFFIKNKDKTFKYKESLAFVEGGEGTAIVKETSNNKVILSITSTRRNQRNGEMETNTFDYEIQYENGKYFRGTKADYYEEGTIRKDQNDNEYLSLDGEQSSVKFSLE